MNGLTPKLSNDLEYQRYRLLHQNDTLRRHRPGRRKNRFDYALSQLSFKRMFHSLERKMMVVKQEISYLRGNSFLYTSNLGAWNVIARIWWEFLSVVGIKIVWRALSLKIRAETPHIKRRIRAYPMRKLNCGYVVQATHHTRCDAVFGAHISHCMTR